MLNKYKFPKLSFLAIIFSMAAYIFLVPTVAKAATVDATLLFNPNTNSTTMSGTNVTFTARVNPGSNNTQGVNAVQLDITFVPAVVHLVSATAAAPFVPMSTPDIAAANASGTLSVPYFIGGGQVTALSDVATLVFSPQGIGSNSPIAYALTANAAVNDGNGTLVASTRTGATITVASNGSDITPPVISAGTPSGQLAAGTTQQTVSVTTDENASCQYATTSGVIYGDSPAIAFTTGEGSTAHSFIATGLISGGTYGYYVRCQDVSVNLNKDTTDTSIAFSIASPAVNPPSSGSSSSNHQSSNKKAKTSPRKISNSKKTISRGSILTQRGNKFSKNALIWLYFSKSNGGYYAPQKIKSSATGSFVITYRVNKSMGRYGWYALDTKTGKKSKSVYYNVK